MRKGLNTIRDSDGGCTPQRARLTSHLRVPHLLGIAF
jgi:hypothetical protein